MSVSCGLVLLIAGCSGQQEKPLATRTGPLKPAPTTEQKLDELKKANMPESQRRFLENQTRSGQDRH